MAYPYGELSTKTTATEVDPDLWNDDVVTPLNDLLDELGGNPRGSASSVEARLDEEHANDGKHSGNVVLAESDVPALGDYLKVDGTDEMEGNLDLSSYHLTGMSYEVGIGYNKLIGASYKTQIGDKFHAPTIPVLTTAERNALVGCKGMIIYNDDTNDFEGWGPTSWKALGLYT